MSVAAVAAAAIVAGATSYAAVNASDNADKQRKSLDLNTAAGRKTAEQLASIQHDDLLRQLNEKNSEFKARLGLQQQTQDNYSKVLWLGAGLGAIYLIRKKR